MCEGHHASVCEGSVCPSLIRRDLEHQVLPNYLGTMILSVVSVPHRHRLPPPSLTPRVPRATASRLGYVSWSRASLQCRRFWLIAHPSCLQAHPSCLEAHPSCLEALKMKCACAAPTLSASVPSDLAAEDTHTTYHPGFHHPRPGFLQVQPEPLACAHPVLRRPLGQAGGCIWFSSEAGVCG